jgi:hypothetical protein
MQKIIQHLKENWVRHAFETLVVIVGILVAYGLNNWNENRKNKQKAIRYLTEIASDLRTDTSTMNLGIRVIKNFLKNKTAILESTDYSEISTQQLSASFGSPDLRDYPVKDLTFSRIDDFEVFETLKTPELIKDIIHYYSLREERFQGSIDWDSDATQMELNEMKFDAKFEHYALPVPKLGPDGLDTKKMNFEDFEPPFLPLQSEEEVRKAIITYLQTPKIRNIYVGYHWRRTFMIEIFRDQKRQTMALLSHVEDELNRLK